MEKDYRELLKEISLLNEEYHMVIEGRKEIINKIRSRIKEIRKITTVCNPELEELESYYSYRDYYINDYKFVMSLLLRLANLEEDKYSMKELKITDFFDIGKEQKQLFSKVLFITDNTNMKKYGDQLYYYDEFKEKATRSINKGHSMILVTSNLFESDVKPRKESIKCDSIVNIRNGGITGDITCYINSIGLKEAIDMFNNYVNINGPDFSNIDEDSLFDLITDTNKYQKKLVK